MQKRLTVILPVYNAMPFLPNAVESILGQSLTDFSFIIVNDGSTDESSSYLHTLMDPRIEVINQTNAGQGAARNLALSRCQTDYVALMDADDIAKPNRLRAQIDYLDSHPAVVILGTQFEFLVGAVPQRAPAVPSDHDGIEARLLKGRAGLCHPSLMFRTAPALACGGYPTGVFGEDLEFCLRMCELGRAANLDQVLFQYRLQSAQTSMAKSKEVIRVSTYAAHRASCRRAGLPEPTMDDFVRHASWFNRFQWSKEAWELIQYRKARIQLASGKKASGIIRLAFLGVCRPVSALSFVSNAFRLWRKGSDREPVQVAL